MVKMIVVEVLQKSVFDVKLTDEQFEQLVAESETGGPFFDTVEALENITGKDLYDEYTGCAEIWETDWFEK